MIPKQNITNEINRINNNYEMVNKCTEQMKGILFSISISLFILGNVIEYTWMDRYILSGALAVAGLLKISVIIFFIYDDL